MKAGTTYKYKFFVIIGGKEYYSDFFSFTTKAPSSSTITPTVSVSFANNTSKYTVGETTATVARTISVSGASVSSVTKVGAVLYNSSGSQLTSKSETPVPKDGVINAWHTIGSGQELNYALTAETTYKYRFFVTISGENYYSDYFTFTTNAPLQRSAFLLPTIPRPPSARQKLFWPRPFR